ncbi:MAG: hypothetical protein BGO28_01075 [Alphaproteobacteria bacterium 43-37]|mgnify:CR=1 FL=1|nr:MAG: hypothetical protein BGO28_01075 [Alphaproteobacteria bacterium 43-37]
MAKRGVRGGQKCGARGGQKEACGNDKEEQLTQFSTGGGGFSLYNKKPPFVMGVFFDLNLENLETVA